MTDRPTRGPSRSGRDRRCPRNDAARRTAPWEPIGSRLAPRNLPADRDELLLCLVGRNEREDANALTVTPDALDDFFARFDPPATDEDVIACTGDLDVLAVAFTEARGQ
ncbi:hypothetical protein [Streptomyces sp. YGL11-2]|uniref:hypothetical protein n=1 Tax=Streptomyces sp. YGL11-2 TaxID=3414028 RepID=UPI003CE72011